MNISITEDISIDRARRTVCVAGQDVQLTALEFGLLDYLSSRPNRICSREELIENVWGDRFQYDTGTIDVHLSALRRKLGFSKTRPIETIRGAGLIFCVEQRIPRYTIDLQAFTDAWFRRHAVALQAHGLTPVIRLTPFVNELTIEPDALRRMFDAILDALLPTAKPGYIRLNSRLTMQAFILAIDINGTVNELRIPIK